MENNTGIMVLSDIFYYCLSLTYLIKSYEIHVIKSLIFITENLILSEFTLDKF